MTFEELTDRLKILTGGTFIMGVILFWLAVRLFRRSRGATYWIHRRKAGRQGFQVLVVAMIAFSVSMALCIATFVFNAVEDRETPTPVAANPTLTATVPTVISGSLETPSATPTAEATTFVAVRPEVTETPSLSLSATITATPTETASVTSTATHTRIPASPPASPLALPDDAPTVTVTATSRASATATASMTDTPTPTLSPTSSPTPTVTLSPTATASITATATLTATPSVTPFPTLASVLLPVMPKTRSRPDAQLTVRAVSTAITDEWQPVNPGQAFSAGFRRVYFFIRYDHLTTGVLWQWRLFKDGEYLDGQAALWGNGTEGETLFFYGLEHGFTPGRYELRLYVGDKLVDAVEFSVNP